MNQNKNLSSVTRKYSKHIDFLSLNRDINFKVKSAEDHRKLASRYTIKEKRKNCPVCSESNCTVFVNVYDYDYVECANCNHIYLLELISEEQTKELYLGEENNNLQHNVYLNEELFNKRVSQIASPKVDWVIENTDEKGLWVDIGCGTGEILIAAKQNGYEVRGVDSDTKQIKFAIDKGLKVSCDYVDNKNAINYLKDSNVVSLFNILEHLEYPVNLLKIISESVDIGCYVVIEVPRHPSISSLSNLIFNDISSRHIYPPDHMHIFTENSMDIMLRKCKLIPVSIWTFGQDIYEFFMSALASKNINTSSFIEDIIKKTPSLQRCVDESGLSDTMIVLCRKI